MNTTLNRHKSPNVIHLDQHTACCACGKSIRYSSKTYFDQTSNHIGLDCWEKEKVRRKEDRDAIKELERQKQLEIDKQSIHFAGIGDKVKVNARLEKIIFLYESKFSMMFLNVFRTDDGNIITYIGNQLINQYELAVFNDLAKTIKQESLYSFMDVLQCTSREPELIEEWNAQGYIDYFQKQLFVWHSEHDNKSVTTIVDGEYVELSGTVKENQKYNEVNQTLIQRPKIKTIGK